MKKTQLFALLLVLTVSLAACRGNDPKESQSTGGAGESSAPSSEPFMETNIPDPTVESNSTMPEMPDMTDEATGASQDSGTEAGAEGDTDATGESGTSSDSSGPSDGGDAGQNQARNRLMRKF